MAKSRTAPTHIDARLDLMKSIRHAEFALENTEHSLRNASSDVADLKDQKRSQVARLRGLREGLDTLGGPVEKEESKQ
jgi:hypothetical protein